MLSGARIPEPQTEGRRALQIEYAALDAACLLMLLDSFMACAPPHLSTQTANPTAEPTTAQTHSPAAAGAVCTLRPCLDAAKASGSGDEHEDEDVDGDARADACPIASGRCSSQHPSRNGLHSDAPAVTGGSPPTAAPGDGPSPTALGVSPAAAVGGVNAQQAGRVPQQLPQEQVEQSEHQAAVKQAMEHWACRLEMSSAGKGSKPRARRHLSRRQRAHIRHAMEQQNQIDNAAGQSV